MALWIGVPDRSHGFRHVQCSKLGGFPIWYEPRIDLFTRRCGTCEKNMVLIAQIYAPMEFERVVFILGCNSLHCATTKEGWCIVRLQDKTKSTSKCIQEPKIVQKENSKSIHDLIANTNWDSDSEEEIECKQPDLETLLAMRDEVLEATIIEKLNGRNGKKSHPLKKNVEEEAFHEHVNLSSLPCLPLRIEEEPEEEPDDTSYEEALYTEYLKQEQEEHRVENTPVLPTGGSSHGEKYEKTPAREKYFRRFQERLKRVPKQCLRYDYGGQPLWIAPPPQLTIPNCECGQKRVFEMQLMPVVNFVLHVDAHAENHEGMDWGTITIWSCPDSCIHSNTEVVVIQASVL